jgi:Protein of unknown function (Hypoth_ymh)
MSRRDLAQSIIRDGLSELDASVRIIWFIQRVEGATEATLSDLVSFFGNHAISNPNKSRLRSKILADKRILQGSTSSHVRLRAAELSQLDDKLAWLYPDAENEGELAGIEYHGIAGGSEDCQLAVLRLLQCRTEIASVRILSCRNNHCLLLQTGIGDRIAIKSGFASGYVGEGPTRFSMTLEALRAHGVEIDECEVAEVIIERIDDSSLTAVDLATILSARAIRPSRWNDYLLEQHYESDRVWTEFPPAIPLAIVDARIRDLALKFWQGPDEALLKAYRRLEDTVRNRTGIKEHGTKLFSKAFHPASGPLSWKDLDEGERAGRSQLFTASFMAHRNPRAHKEVGGHSAEQLSEFLLLNHLFRLERDAGSLPKAEAA